MYQSTLVLAFIAVASAASSTTSIWLPGFEGQNVVASVLSVSGSATAYALACATPAATDCLVPNKFTLTEGPSTIRYALTVETTETIKLACQITGSSTGNCQVTVNSVQSGTSLPVKTTTETLAASDLIPMAITITAGGATGSGSKTAASTTGASASSTATSIAAATGSSSSSASMTTSGSAAPAATDAAGSSKVSTGGVAIITQAPWVMGAAAVVAYAAL